jgi:hypothetical protein
LGSCIEEHSAQITANSANAQTPNGDSNQANLNGNDATSNFNVAGNSGDVNANSQDDSFNNLQATGPNGEQQTATIDGTNANLGASTGDQVNAKADGGASHSEAVVNGGNTYNVDRPVSDKAEVHAESEGANYHISGIDNKNIHVSGDGIKDMDAAFKQTGNGATGTQLKVHEFGNVGPKYYNNLLPPDAQTDGSSNMGLSPFDTGGAINPLDSLSPSVTVTADKIKSAPCPEKAFGDAFGDNGFKINDINVELPPTDDDGTTKTWVFPGCFVVKASITIPPNIDVKNVGAQADVNVAQAGQLQCDSQFECKSGASGKPQGSCFYCDFCQAGATSKSGAVFGGNTAVDWNICEGKPGGTLPLNWKVCPSDSDSNYQVLQPSIFSAFKSDITATIKIFVKKAGAGGATKPPVCSNPFLAAFYPACKSNDAGEQWQLMGCKSTVISYKVNAGGAQFGNAKGGGGVFGRK